MIVVPDGHGARWLSRSLSAFALALLLLAAACTAPVRVEWTTETEIDTAGFNLYRAEAAGGPFELKINDRLIPASPDPMTGGTYHFVDQTARPGTTYYYRLEEVENSGTKTAYGPIEVQASWLALAGPPWALALGAVIFIGAVAWAVRENRTRIAQKE